MKVLIASAMLVLAAPVQGQIYTGSARAVDGDTLEMTNVIVRLFGIDAPEARQSCLRDNADWQCGLEAHKALASLIDGQIIRCQQHGSDPYERIVATCLVGETDPAERLIRGGLAVALPDFTERYVASEQRARAARIGIWAGNFDLPSEWRTAHPDMTSKPSTASRERANPAAAGNPSPARELRTIRSNVYFRRCSEAWAAGAAPLRRGDPGYRSGLDGDNDGVACEPYRKRR